VEMQLGTTDFRLVIPAPTSTVAPLPFGGRSAICRWMRDRFVVQRLFQETLIISKGFNLEMFPMEYVAANRNRPCR